jgi:hypothetical protein
VINGLDQNSKYCLSADRQCEKLFIPPSNQRKPDSCNRYGKFIDRDRSRKPVRCVGCLSEFPINGD